MKQITEDYVSFEIAKLLKEKGFNAPCHCYYRIKKLDYGPEEEYDNETLEFDEHKSYSAPTHQMALKWLREVYNIFIEINVSIDINGAYHYAYSILDKECKYIKRFVGYYSTHKLCVEAALDYVLKNLI